MIILESMPDGILYSNLLLKMYLMSLKDEGQLFINGQIPHTLESIATVTRHSIETVEKGISIFLQLGLVEQMTNGAYYMTDIQLFIGKSSSEGDRKRRARQALEQHDLLPAAHGSYSPSSADICPASVVDICPPILEIEKETKIDTEIERESDLDRSNATTPTLLGRYQNVRLTEQELQELKAE